MSMSLGELLVQLNMDASGFSKGIDGAEKELKDFQAAANAASTVLAAVSGAFAAAGAVAVKYASDFNETTNVMQQAFGRQTASAEKWARDQAGIMGRATQQMREFESVNQAMLSSMLGSAEAAVPLSQNMAKLAVDMGSFWNVSDKEAFEALRSGLTGIAKPMERFGVVMLENSLDAYLLENGIHQTMQTLSEAEKVQVRYNFIMEKTKIVHDDAARTSDSFANQMKRLQGNVQEAATALGDALLPAATSIINKLNGWADGLAKLDTDTIETTKLIGVMTIAVTALTAAFLKLAGGAGAAMAAAALAAAPVALVLTGVALAGTAVYTGVKNSANDGGIHDEAVARADRDRQRSFEAGRRVTSDFFETTRSDARPGLAPVSEMGRFKGMTEDEEREAMLALLEQKYKMAGKKIGELAKAGADASFVGPAEPSAMDRMREERTKKDEENKKKAEEKAAKLESEHYYRTQELLDSYSKKTSDAYWANQKEQDKDGQEQLAKDRAQADAQRKLEWDFDQADLAETAALKKKDRDETDKQDESDRNQVRRATEEQQRKRRQVESSMMETMKQIGAGNFSGALGSGTSSILQMKGMSKDDAGVGGGLVSMIAGGIQSFFTAIIDVVKQIGNQAVDVAKSFLPADSRMAGASGKAMAMGGLIGTTAAFPLAPLAAFGAGIFELTKSTKSYTQYQAAMTKGVDRLVLALEPAFQQLMPLAGLFIQLSSSVAIMLANIIPGPPIAHALFEGFRNLATGLAWTMVGFINLRVAMTQYEAGLFKFLNEYVFHGKDDNIKKLAGETGGDAQRALDERQALIENAKFIGSMTEASASALATSEALDKLTRSTTNMPSGYRVDVAAARAQDANGTRPSNNGVEPGNYVGSVPGGAGGSNGGGGGAGQQSQQQRAWDEMVSNLARAAANLANSKDYVNTGNARRPTRYAGRT